VKIYTRTGDRGQTGLIGGKRVAKDSPRIEAIGTVDELNAVIGMARLHSEGQEMDAELCEIQNRLFDLGADLATTDARSSHLNAEDVARLETGIDAMTASLPPLRNFVLPGGCPLAAALHFARAVSRRAERVVLTLHAEEPLSAEALAYLNRLSDWLFTAARTANTLANVSDVVWQQKGTSK